MKNERLEKLKVKVSGFKLKDMLNFKNLPLRRDKAIEAAEDKSIVATFPINENAKVLHPLYQRMVVKRIVEHRGAGAKTMELVTQDGKRAAWFRAGQYVSVKMRIGDSLTSRPYSICSSPALTKEGVVCITVKETKDGFVSDYLLNNVHEGDQLVVSGPDGFFYHDSLRDSANVVAIAGGSGITPFLSMACAIRDGVEDFNLTIIYGSRTEDSILFLDKLNQICKATDKVKVVHVLSDETKEGFEHGFITAELIQRYAPEEYSLFICGPKALYGFMDEESKKLGLPGRRIRREILGPTFDGSVLEGGKTFRLRVIQGPSVHETVARSDESILVAMERAGIEAPSKCRGGECGWCRSKLVSGEVYIPEQNDKRRYMDKQTGHIHPCVSFPLSDIVIEVPFGDYPDKLV